MSHFPTINKSDKLTDVLYDIRGPVLSEAQHLEQQGVAIQHLNIGNPAPFGFDASAHIRENIALNLRAAQGYCESKGIPAAREAVLHHYRQQGIAIESIEQIYIGNGVSELIVSAMQALLNNGDEILIPAPDYPLWTAAVRLSGGIPRHYRCDESADWQPDIADIRSKIGVRTRAIVIINPNNPTGSLYSLQLLQEMVELAARHQLIVFSDEIYDQVIYDQHRFYSVGTLCKESLCVLFNGLSKNWRACGYRAGWMVLCGATASSSDYQEGLNMLSNMRLCSNVPSQFAIAPALQQPNDVHELIAPGGRLYQQRARALQYIEEIEGLSCVAPRATFYLFPRLEQRRFNITSDVQFAFDLLRQAHLLVVHGSGFNCPDHLHFRIVFLPQVEELESALGTLGSFLASYRQGDSVRY